MYTTNALTRDRLFHPKQNPYHDDGVRVYFFKNTVYKPSLHIYFSRELVEVIKKSIVKYDIVHLHEYRSYISLLTSYYAQRYNVPYVLQAHGQLPRIFAKQRLKWIYDAFFGRRLLMNASKVIAVGETEAEQYKSIGVLEGKIAIVPNGIDLSEYADLPPKGSFKARFSINDHERIILYVGRIHIIKGINILLRAFSHIAEKLENVKLVVVGPDDGYLSTCRNLARQLKVEENVLFTGALFGAEKLEAYVDADVFVLPSRYEIFGNVVLESYACSKPVVASKVGGLQEIVFHEETGLLVMPDVVNELSSAILRLLKDDKSRTTMGMRARRVVEEKFSLEKVADRLEATYGEILRGQELA